jgi:hypothetical protein
VQALQENQNCPVGNITSVQASIVAIPADSRVAAIGGHSDPGLKITRFGFNFTRESAKVAATEGFT